MALLALQVVQPVSLQGVHMLMHMLFQHELTQLANFMMACGQRTKDNVLHALSKKLDCFHRETSHSLHLTGHLALHIPMLVM